MKRLFASVLVGLVAASAICLAGCGASAKDPTMSTQSTTPTSDDESSASSASSSEPADLAYAPPLTAKSRADLAQHQGKPLRVEGTFRFPTEQAFARLKLVLDDGTEVILPPPPDDSRGDEPGAAELVDVNSGRRMAISGVVYVDKIPEQYGIVSRTPDPYLFELSAVELLK